MSELKACPCGTVPQSLYWRQDDNYYRYIVVADGGGCCGEWAIGFKVNPRHLAQSSAEFEKQAIEAWNAAPRAANG